MVVFSGFGVVKLVEVAVTQVAVVVIENYRVLRINYESEKLVKIVFIAVGQALPVSYALFSTFFLPLSGFNVYSNYFLTKFLCLLASNYV